MKASEILAQIRQTFNELTKAAEVPQPTDQPAAPMMKKLQDGSEISISAMEVGGIVMKEGQPMPAGSYILEDGSVLVLGDNGVIMEITKSDIAPASDPAAQMNQQYAKEKIESLQMRIQKFEASANEKYSFYESKFKEYEDRLTKATKVIEGLLNLTQTLADTPTGIPDPVVKSSSSMFKEQASSAAIDLLFTS